MKVEVKLPVTSDAYNGDTISGEGDDRNEGCYSTNVVPNRQALVS